MLNLTNLNFNLSSYYITDLIFASNNKLIISTVEGDLFSINLDLKNNQYTANFIT